jgi:hypothetical protein
MSEAAKAMWDDVNEASRRRHRVLVGLMRSGAIADSVKYRPQLDSPEFACYAVEEEELMDEETAT